MPDTPLDIDARKAVARRFGKGWPVVSACDKFYPKCCSYHEGFDDALAEFGAETVRRRERERLLAVPTYVIREDADA